MLSRPHRPLQERQGAQPAGRKTEEHFIPSVLLLHHQIRTLASMASLQHACNEAFHTYHMTQLSLYHSTAPAPLQWGPPLKPDLFFVQQQHRSKMQSVFRAFNFITCCTFWICEENRLIFQMLCLMLVCFTRNTVVQWDKLILGLAGLLHDSDWSICSSNPGITELPSQNWMRTKWKKRETVRPDTSTCTLFVGMLW